MILGLLLVLVGVIGCIIPAIPGPPLSFIGILLLHFGTGGGEIFSNAFLIGWGIATAVVFIADYIIPLLGGKLHGISRWGTWGSIIGMILGLVFFPPFGIILGILIGAICGELIAGKEHSKALKAGFASFAGTMVAMTAKLVVSAVLGFFYIKETIVYIASKIVG